MPLYSVPGLYISIHALREEGDLSTTHMTPYGLIFLSTPSARRATLAAFSCRQMFVAFLSTPSARRATPTHHGAVYLVVVFLSTPSARRATQEGGAGTNRL